MDVRDKKKVIELLMTPSVLFSIRDQAVCLSGKA